jgi:acyl-CoA reductase-like NAD-dependent aldehyde dehydrogenase
MASIAPRDRPLIVDNPYSGEVHCAVRYHSDAEVGAIVDKAAQQQRSWRDVPLGQRLDIVNKCVVLIRHSRSLGYQPGFER